MQTQQTPYPANQGQPPVQTQQMPQQQPIPQGYAPQPQTPPPAPEPAGKSGLAIAGLVLGIVAVATSFMPIINNASFFIGIVGLVLGTVGLVQTRKGTKSGKGLSIAAIVLNVVACIAVIASQAFYSSVIDEAFSTSSASVVSSSSTTSSSSMDSNATASSASSSSASTSSASTTDMPLGTIAEVGDGLQVTVNSVTPGLLNFDDTEIVAVNVTYTNTGSKNASFNVYDWKAETAQGVQTSQTYYSESENELNSGTLAPNGTITGNIYFDPDVAKVLYIENMFTDRSVSWLV